MLKTAPLDESLDLIAHSKRIKKLEENQKHLGLTMNNLNYVRSDINSNPIIEYPSDHPDDELSLTGKIEELEEKQKRQSKTIDELIARNEHLNLQIESLKKYCGYFSTREQLEDSLC